MCILVSASFITQSKAIVSFGKKDGKRYSKFSLEADKGSFNQNSLDEGRTIRDLCVAMRDVCEGRKLESDENTSQQV
ncbi:unnamed protein product [Pocillopora meandrina]|uniref:Uncharacterized protein n=1 Tax=Pocillopora meandrina TaxID=46732 RepID=A0AAU9XDF4_9CNID|nr:unnamed protein product [Pocillopora meandrina]